MTVVIKELDGIEDLRRLAALFGAVWGRPGEPPINSDVLKAFAHSGNYVSGAYAGERLVGGLVGWLGGVPPHEIHMHSHILGVLSGQDAKGVGFQLKQHQRRWCLARGVRVIEWTTDPLVRRNVYFNLTKLGARAPRYLVNVYGEMTDGINAGEESDRLLIRWELDSPEAEAAAAGRPSEPQIEALRAGGAAVLMRVGANGEPVIEDARAAILLCQVPDDIVEVRAADPARARAWRLAVRSVLEGATSAGLEITGATRTGWYVLESRAE